MACSRMNQPQKMVSDILALAREIRLCINCTEDEPSFVLKSLADNVAQYMHSWSILFDEETRLISEVTDAVGKELLFCLKAAFHLLQFSGEGIRPSIGQYSEIVDDTRRYAHIMNRWIGHVLTSLKKTNSTGKIMSWHRSLGGNLQSEGSSTSSNNSLFNKIMLWEQNIKPPDDKEQSDGKLTSLEQTTARKWSEKVVSWQQLIKHLEDKVQSDGMVSQSLLNGVFKSKYGDLSNRNPVSFVPWSDLEIEEHLGSGSYGQVYKAKWHGLPVAVKTLSGSEDIELSLVNREIKVAIKLQALDSSHIIQLMGYSEDLTAGKKSLILELMDIDLKELIKDKRSQVSEDCPPFSLPEAVDIMLQISKGMRHLHSNDVVHRDIKPSNVLLKIKANGTFLVKLADFGCSKDEFSSKGLHTLNKGSWFHIAPEMFTGKVVGRYKRSVDVYSFGITCYEILTGNQPSAKESLDTFRQQLLKGRRPDIPDGIPRRLDSLIRQCWHKKASKRPTFEKICEELWNMKEEILTKSYKLTRRSMFW